MASKLIQSVVEIITNSQIWKSFFRRKHNDSRMSRALAIVGNFFMHLHPVTIARHGVALKYTWCMGGSTTFIFLFLALTGVVLMFYYHPTTTQAFNDIKELEYSVPFGMMLRNTHRWGAHLMVITVMIHMFRVFMTGSYKPPREFNWVIGVVLLLITFLLSFSGYLLTWDQLGMWAITVGTNMARSTPFVGSEGPFGEQLGRTPYNDIRFLILGSSTVGGSALLRAYILHCVALPLVLTIFMSVHFWRIRKDGGISGPL
ncbi:MAG TPA: cytochrome b N-terminal domain-containing protein [Candidatus Brocadiales bacterium]|nr:cytochrome b N-terminal domain-containing protein [Candidatus Brocadiales bacterium]